MFCEVLRADEGESMGSVDWRQTERQMHRHIHRQTDCTAANGGRILWQDQDQEGFHYI